MVYFSRGQEVSEGIALLVIPHLVQNQMVVAQLVDRLIHCQECLNILFPREKHY